SLLVAGRSYFYSASNKALEIGHRSVFFAEKQGDQLKLADCYRFLGACYVDFKNDYDSAHYYYGRAESLYQSLNSIEASNGEGAALHNYGVIQHYLGDYLKSIEYYTKALSIFDVTGESKTRPMTLNNLAVLYAYVKDPKKSEKYARECVEL